jgi:hypothetical protein
VKIIKATLLAGNGIDYVIHDDTKADRAYEALRSGLASYRAFGNDASRVVEIDLDNGKAVFRLAELTSVTLDKFYDPASPEFIERTDIDIALKLGRERREKAARAQLDCEPETEGSDWGEK